MELKYCEGCEEPEEEISDINGYKLCENCADNYENKTGHCSLNCCLTGYCDSSC